MTDPQVAIFHEIAAERERQDVKHPKDDHPLIGGLGWDTAGYQAKAEKLKQINRGLAKAKSLTWDSIALEELYEAFAETDPHKAYEEFVQAGAVVVRILEHLRRRRA